MSEGIKMPVVRPLVMSTKGKSVWYRIRQSFKRRRWLLVEPYTVYFKSLNKKYRVPVPFIFDFASVPIIFWPILNPTGVLLVGSVFHDYGYRYGGLYIQYPKENKFTFRVMSRGELDQLFEDITIEANGMKYLAKAAKWAVKVGGAYTWRQNKKKNLHTFKA